MRVNSLSREQVFHALVSSEQGLTEGEARKRLIEAGPNEIREARRVSLAKMFFRQFTHFLAALLWIGAALAFLSEHLNPGEGMLTLGIAIVGVIMVNALFTFSQEYRAERSFTMLQRLLPYHVRVVREGREQEIAASQVVPGDVILFAEGDKVPADSRLIEAVRLFVSNAALTGESEPMALDPIPSEGELLGSRNIVFAGTSVVSGSGKGVVFATGMGTEFGRIAHLTGTVDPGLSPLQREIVKVTRIIAAFATVMGVIFFLIGQAMGRGFWENFLFAIGIIVANVPEGLLPTVTLSLAMGSQRMAKKKALIKTLISVETLGAVSVICTDKTGTLTQNRMETRTIWDGSAMRAPADIGSKGRGMLLNAALCCTNARVVDGELRGDPTETAILRTALAAAPAFRTERMYEIPFDSDRRRMTVVNKIEGRPFAFMKGAVESVLPACRAILRGGVAAPLDQQAQNEVIAANHLMMDQGLRVLAFAYKESEVSGERSKGKTAPSPLAPHSALEENLVFLGLIGLEDPPRPEVPEALRKCREAGIKVIMITGDGSRTAVAIAREIGLVEGEPSVIEGREFSGMSDREFREKLAAREVIFARMAPKHKLRVVSILKDEGERVAVTGDGVNDAPALRKADIGIAMGIAGNDVAKEAADMILLDDNFATIVNAIEEGRAVYENIRKFVSYIFSSNIPEIVPYLAYVLFRIPLPLTIMQILAVDLGTDMLPALALGAERPSPEVMKRPPRPPKERLLSGPILARAYLFLGPIEAAAGLFGFFSVLTAGGWTWGELLPSTDPLYLQATTACLTAIIITQIANVFACRSFRESLFRLGIFSNPLIFAGIITEVILLVFIAYHPLGNRIFSTHPIPIDTWLILLPFAAFLLLSEEARKLVVRSLPGIRKA